MPHWSLMTVIHCVQSQEHPQYASLTTTCFVCLFQSEVSKHFQILHLSDVFRVNLPRKVQTHHFLSKCICFLTPALHKQTQKLTPFLFGLHKEALAEHRAWTDLLLDQTCLAGEQIQKSYLAEEELHVLWKHTC